MKLQRQIAKNRVVQALPVALLMATNAWAITTNYIDENGNPAKIECTLIDQSYLNSNHNNMPNKTCFAVNSTISLDGRVLSHYDITLILSDIANLTINYDSPSDNQHALEAKDNSDNLHDIKIYGSLTVNSTTSSYLSRGISAQNIYIYGGHVTATSNARDAIWANGDIDIYGGYISATSNATGYDGIESETGNININWVNSLYASSYSTPLGAVNFTNGLSLKGDNGTNYSGSNPSIAGKTLTPADYLVQFVTNADNSKRAIIDGESSSTLNIPSATDVVSIDYNRTFTAGVPATVVLPFSLPEGATTNAKFYRIIDVVQLENTCAWNATAKNITKIDNIPDYPEANIPYIVLLDNGGKLTFDLHGATATFAQTTNPVTNPTTTVSDGNWSFIGVYSFKEWRDPNDKELGLAYAFAGSNENNTKQGKFGKIAIAEDAATTGYPYANPFRAYLKKRDSNVKLQCPQAPQAVLGRNSAQYSIGHTSESIDVQFIDEDENGGKTTFMARMNTRTGEFTMLPNYDAKGRKIAAPKVRGAYYGKKVLKNKDVK